MTKFRITSGRRTKHKKLLRRRRVCAFQFGSTMESFGGETGGCSFSFRQYRNCFRRVMGAVTVMGHSILNGAWKLEVRSIEVSLAQDDIAMRCDYARDRFNICLTKLAIYKFVCPSAFHLLSLQWRKVRGRKSKVASSSGRDRVRKHRGSCGIS